MGLIKLKNKNYIIKIELGYEVSGRRRRIQRVFYGTKKDAIKYMADLKKKYLLEACYGDN